MCGRVKSPERRFSRDHGSRFVGQDPLQTLSRQRAPGQFELRPNLVAPARGEAAIARRWLPTQRDYDGPQLGRKTECVAAAI